jgi:hypothetical protein
MKNNEVPTNKKYFYYLRDEYGLPRVTVCLAHFTEEDVITRGVAICSILDQPTKKLGNIISAGRAIKAYKLRENCRPVASDNAFHNVEMLEMSSYLTMPDSKDMYEEKMFKCYFSPNLTEYELALIGG